MKENADYYHNDIFRTQYFSKEPTQERIMETFQSLGIIPKVRLETQPQETWVYPQEESLRHDVKEQDSVAIILSHRDLDGVASACILYIYAREVLQKQALVLLDWNPTKQKTEEMLHLAETVLDRSLKEQDHIFICDREMVSATCVESYMSQHDCPSFTHMDHHAGNKYEESLLVLDAPMELYLETGKQWCGTTIAEQYVARNGIDWNQDNVKEFAIFVNLWDTFLWKDAKSDLHRIGKQYGTLDKTLTTDMLFEAVMRSLVNGSDILRESALTVTDILKPLVEQCATVFEEAFEEEYRKQCQNVVIVYLEECGYYMAHFTHCHPVFGSMVKDRYFSEWMNTIYSTGDSYDEMLKVIVCWNEFGGTVYVEDDDYDPIKAYDLARTFGKYFGCSGGGHAKAAGFRHVKEGASPYSVYLKIDQILCNAFEYYQVCYPNEDNVYVTVSKKGEE